MDRGTCNTSTIAHDDVISTMLDKVISNILNRVPLHRVLLGGTNACKRFNTVMPCLKTLHLWRVDFASSITTLNVFQLIFGSPNFKNIKIETAYKDKSPPTSLDFSEEDFAAMGQLQLQSHNDEIGKLTFALKLLRLHRASPVAEILL
uniref:FBD domain, leucine-rich repeat domain, L domain-like protein n=1 Tax=Tanacetum cinerariifolium TaxID=118510 RepID=A0A6L2NPI0_TANCI|nr:FBD domain, leucine-rich repeat domain, L domain-like protein [Tanacetum cinerariifolium]